MKNKLGLLIISTILTVSIYVTFTSLSEANAPMPKIEINNDFFEGADEIIIWTSQTQGLRGTNDIYEKVPRHLLEEKCKKYFLKNIPNNKKNMFNVKKLSDTNIQVSKTKDETNIFLKCSVSYKKTEIDNKQLIVGSVNFHLWRLPPKNLYETTRVSGFHKHFTAINTPSMFVAGNLDEYEAELDKALEIGLKRIAKQIDKYDLLKQEEK